MTKVFGDRGPSKWRLREALSITKAHGAGDLTVGTRLGHDTGPGQSIKCPSVWSPTGAGAGQLKTT
jgi:hypothetical protein